MNYASTILAETSLVSYWKLDEVSGTTVIDAKGLNNGTYVNTVTLGQTPATAEGTSVLFSATPGYADMGTPIGLPTTGAYSLEAWVKVNSGTTINSSNQLSIIGYGSGASLDKYNVLDFFSTTLIRNWWWQNDMTWTIPDCTDGLWHHYITTFDGVNSKCYRDTVQLPINFGNPTRTGINANLTNLGIGLSPSNAGGSTQLKYIDEVAIYSADLTLAQIQTHYAIGLLQYNNYPLVPSNYLINRKRKLL